MAKKLQRLLPLGIFILASYKDGEDAQATSLAFFNF
jgi:hypothetical protein